MKKNLDIVISVDWEGLSLDDYNIQKILKFKHRWGIPLTHFVSPGYWTFSATQKAAQYLEANHSVFKGDEIGLHLHAPAHFIKEVGISLRTSPAFSHSGDENDRELTGQEVMLFAYDEPEFLAIVQKGLEILQAQGFTDLHSFRAGGWMLGPHHHQVLQDLGFYWDSSAVPHSALKGTIWERENLYRYARVLWQGVSANTQPYSLLSHLTEVPNHLGAIDYWKADQVQSHLEQVLSQSLEDSSRLLVLTCHQETFAENEQKMNDFMYSLYRQRDYQLRFIKIDETSVRSKSSEILWSDALASL